MNPEGSRGTTYGLLAFTLWGAFPLYFRLLERSGPLEIVAHRVFWSLVICLGIVAATRNHRQIVDTLTNRRQASLLTTAAVLIAVNWSVYVYAVNSDQVVEASLGYFINPLVTVLLGVVVLRERLRLLQWTAVGIGAVAVGVLTFTHGRPPVIALTLAGTFGLYSLMKKKVGATVGAVAGITAETLILGPVAASLIVWLHLDGSSRFTTALPWHGLLLMSTGLVTIVPLLLFAAATRRVPLSTIGLMQYLTPVLQFLCGVLLLGEHMSPPRWAGFGIVWLALTVLTIDGLRASRQREQASRTPGPTPSPFPDEDQQQASDHDVVEGAAR